MRHDYCHCRTDGYIVKSYPLEEAAVLKTLLPFFVVLLTHASELSLGFQHSFMRRADHALLRGRVIVLH